MEYEKITMGEVVSTKPVWKIKTRDTQTLTALALTAGLIVRPEVGDTVKVASFQGVWKILYIADVI